MTRGKLHSIWRGMRVRCGLIKCKDPNIFKYYGGKGVTVCNDWLTFEGFREWAERNGYKEGLSIDRLNSDGHYEPSNCQWITLGENVRRRKCVVLTMGKAIEIRRLRKEGFKGAQLAAQFGVARNQIYRIWRSERWA